MSRCLPIEGEPPKMDDMLRGVPCPIFSMKFRIKCVVLIFVVTSTIFASAQSEDLATIRRKAESGDAKAQFDLASAYSQGTGVAKDTAQGIQWLKRSALQGYPGAQVVLGYMYQKGIQMDKDPSEAAKWYKKAARRETEIQNTLKPHRHIFSEMLLEGSISAKDGDWHAVEQSAGTKTASNKQSTKAPAFSLAEVETGLKGGITTKRMTTLVTTYGVDFTLNATARKTLTDDGADDALLQTIASSKH